MSKDFVEFLRTKEQQELESMMDDVLAVKVPLGYTLQYSQEELIVMGLSIADGSMDELGIKKS